MSYLFPITSETELGVVQVGDNINVDIQGVISIPQDVSPDATVTFDTVNVTTSLSLDGKEVVTEVDPSAGAGISITSLISTGPTVSFTVNNTGVLSLTAGNGIALSASTGNIVITATESGTIPTVGQSFDYTASYDDEYIGVTASGVTITLPAGINGKTYVVKNEGTGGNIILTGTAQTLDGAISKTLGNNASITVVFRGTQWHIV